MTRINCTPVETLSDKHLLAEYKELPRIFTAVKKLYDNGGSVLDKDIPDDYKLGAGHVTFFYDKWPYLLWRYEKLRLELKVRDFNVNEGLFEEIIFSAYDFLYKHINEIGYDWIPTPQDMYINMARLCHRHFKTDLKEFS